MANAYTEQKPGKLWYAYQNVRAFFKAGAQYPNKNVAEVGRRNVYATLGIFAATHLYVAPAVAFVMGTPFVALAVAVGGTALAGKHAVKAYREFKYIAQSEKFQTIRAEAEEKWRERHSRPGVLKRAAQGVAHFLHSYPEHKSPSEDGKPFEGIRRSDAFNQKVQPGQTEQPVKMPAAKPPQQQQQAGTKGPR
ncbi:MAG: hypothetical protein H3C49_01495 [Alphaproteobacteria bacterium]|nr:hypothetical protein [Alphaproteobacteria bacterium]